MVQMPYTKPTLTQFGKVTELTHGANGSAADGNGTLTKR
jgi:hypothetical protein